jgi:uncharacterized protein (TIGR02996 family)
VITMTERELFAAVIAHPDDDAPRLAYADHVQASEPAYAELVRLQVARGADERRRKALRSEPSTRERILLREHGLDWAHYFEKYVRESPTDPRDLGWAFDRGFIAFARMEPENFVALGDRLFAMAPIQHADLYGGREPIRPLFAAPGLARLDSLSLRGTGLDDDDAIAIAGCAALRRCTWLDLSDNKIGERGLEAICRSPIMANKVRILMNGNPWDPVDRPSLDWDGSVADVITPSAGSEMERKLGRTVGWFHTATATLPDRFLAKYAPRS